MKKTIFKKVFITGLIIGTIGVSYGLYLFNMPHRDIQAAEIFVEIQASQLVAEFLNDIDAANTKYLDEEGESKVIVVSGTVKSITVDQKNQKVVLLMKDDDNAGVSCTFTAATNKSADLLIISDQVSIKGVVRSGAEVDEDLGLTEDVIMEKCDVVGANEKLASHGLFGQSNKNKYCSK